MKYLLSLLLMFLLCSCGKATVNVESIHSSSENPSISPDQRTTQSAMATASQFESLQKWNEAVARLLDETEVNGVVSLRDYIVAVRDDKTATITLVQSQDQAIQEVGGGYASLRFSLEGGKSVTISNLRCDDLREPGSRSLKTM